MRIKDIASKAKKKHISAFELVNSHYIDEGVITDLNQMHADLENYYKTLESIEDRLYELEQHVLKGYSPELKNTAKDLYAAYWSIVNSNWHLTEAIADVQYFISLCSQNRGQFDAE